MLDRNAMAQLKGLREELEAQNEHVDATVKGTQHRYGFAVTDDGREIFIPPDEMLKVLPGDKVAICIRPAKPVKGKQDKPKACFLLTVVDRAVAYRFTESVRNVESRSPSVPIRAGHSRPRQQTVSSASVAPWISDPQILPTLPQVESDVMPFSRSTALLVPPPYEEITCR